MTNNNKIKKEESAWNSPPRSHTQTPVQRPRSHTQTPVQRIPQRRTPPQIQRRPRPTTPRPTPRRAQNVSNNNWLRFLNSLIITPRPRNNTPRSNVSNQTPLKKKPKKNNNKR